MNNILSVVLTLILFLGVNSSLEAKPKYSPPLDFSAPSLPYLNWSPGPECADVAPMFQGIPSIARAPGGRLWATWYGGGTGESQANYVMLASSSGDGRTWSSPRLIVDPPFCASEPAVWVDPSGKLWFMFNLYPIRSSAEDKNALSGQFEDIAAYEHFIKKYNFVGTQLWVMTTDNPDAEKPVWSAPRLIGMETHNMNKPTVLKDGHWVWPASPVVSTRGMMPCPLFSSDQGRSFFYRGAVSVPSGLSHAHEYQIVEREDGSLWLLDRIRGGIGESFSYDVGRTWSVLKPSSIVHTTSRFYITRLDSGNLLLVKHGAIDQDVGRSELMAFLSKNDGETWSGGLMIDERQGILYPDGEQGSDGLIRIIYDYSRHHEKEILMAVFSEEDVAATRPVSGRTACRLVVNKASGHNYIHQGNDPVAAEIPLNCEPLRKQQSGQLVAEGAEMVALQRGEQLFGDRTAATHLAAEIPEDLSGAYFLRLPIDGIRELRVSESGMVYFLTPQVHRNRPDSQSQALMAQGLKPVDLKEFHLFAAAGNAQLVTLYQKEMKVEERFASQRGRFRSFS